MQYAGLSSLEAIQAGTSNAAVTIGLEGQTGAVAPDMLADLLVIDGDPSLDVTILQDPASIHSIILDGALVDVEDDIESWPYEGSMILSQRYLTREVVASARLGGAHE
jgi:hypothetical protein